MIQDKIYSYFERNPQLKVLFVFDGTRDKLAELENAEWKPEYRFVVFKDNWFTIKYNLTHDWQEDKVVLMFEGVLPPHKNETSFLLYGEMKANAVYSDENYISFMHQRGIRSEFAPYIARHISELQLSKYDKLLADSYKPGIFSVDIGNRALLSGYLGATKLLDWSEMIIRLTCLYGLDSETDRRSIFVKLLCKNADVQNALAEKMKDIAGYDMDIMSAVPMKRFAQSFKYNAITQGLPVSAADDYKEYKISDSSVLQRLNSLLEYATEHPGLSEKFSMSVEKLADEILEENIIKWYGSGADYSYVNDTLGSLILKSMIEERAFTSPVQANAKLRSLTSRFFDKSALRSVIGFMSCVFSMYEKLQSIGTYTLRTSLDYIKKYTEVFYLVDTYYRKAVNSFSIINQSLSIYDSLLSLKKLADEKYAKECNLFNQEWIRCVNESGEELACMKGILHQQNFYNEKLKDLNVKRVVIISDALRYEVAVEIMTKLGKDRHSANLEPALSILPTETKYSKMTLLPYSSIIYNSGAILVDGEDLSAMDKRIAQVKKYEPNALCIDYSELMKLSVAQKRELFKSPLVYVFHDTIDSISHDNPQKTTQACAEAIDELKQLIPMLHASCNVANVFLTSDHGFLFNDMDFEQKDKHKIEDSFDERKSRYYITSDSAPVVGISKYPMENVSSMSCDGRYVAVPNGTNRLYAEGGGYAFAHGGASLEEMIIPVLYSHIQKEGAKPKVGVTLVDSMLSVVSSRLKFNLVQKEPISSEYRERTIVCGVYDGNELLTAEKELVLNSSDIYPSNRVFSIELVLNKATSGGLLSLRIFDVEDKLNPIIKANVIDKTLIEQDF